jgi:hypothetical protein
MKEYYRDLDKTQLALLDKLNSFDTDELMMNWVRFQPMQIKLATQQLFAMMKLNAIDVQVETTNGTPQADAMLKSIGVKLK